MEAPPALLLLSFDLFFAFGSASAFADLHNREDITLLTQNPSHQPAFQNDRDLRPGWIESANGPEILCDGEPGQAPTNCDRRGPSCERLSAEAR